MESSKKIKSGQLEALSNDISTYTPATTPLVGTELALIDDGTGFKKVAVSELAGDFIPLSGTTVGNPVIGDIEFEGFSESKLKSYLEGEGENIIDLTRNDEGVAIMHTRAVDSNTCLLLVNTSNIYYNTTDNNSAGFVSTLDHSLIEPTNKLIYAQRSYVDNQNKIATFTIELIDYLTVDFYASNDLRINTITQILNTPNITILVNDSAYTLTDLISQGDKITITSDVAGVINLNAVYE